MTNENIETNELMKSPLKINAYLQCLVFRLLSNWWKQCSLNDNPNAQKWRLQGALLKIHRKDFSLAGGKASVCKKQNKIFSDTIYEKHEKTRKLIMNLVKQTFQTKANRLEELDYFHFHAQHQQLLLCSKSNELL